MRGLALIIAMVGCSGHTVEVSWTLTHVATGEHLACPRGATFADVHLQHIIDDGVHTLSGTPQWGGAGSERIQRYGCDELVGATSELDDSADNPEDLPSKFTVYVELKGRDDAVLMTSQAAAVTTSTDEVHFDLLFDGGYFRLPSGGHYGFRCFGATYLRISAESSAGDVHGQVLPCEMPLPIYLYSEGLPTGTYKVWMETFDAQWQSMNNRETWTDQVLLTNNDVHALH